MFKYYLEIKGAKQAKKLAIKAHKGQYRKNLDAKGNKIPYSQHPIDVAELVKKIKTSKSIEKLITAAYLHDTVEDTKVTLTQIKIKFGNLVANLVRELTSDKKQIERYGKTKYLIDKMLNMSSWGLVIKLADRAINTQDLNDSPPSFKTKYIKETRQILNELEKKRKLTSTQKKIVRIIYNNMYKTIKEL